MDHKVKEVVCPDCKGKGEIYNGSVTWPLYGVNYKQVFYKTCPTCNGEGVITPPKYKDKS